MADGMGNLMCWHSASKANQAELSIITKLDDLLRYAKYEGSYSDKKGHPDIIAAHKYRAVAKVGNESLNVGVIVREFPDGHKHYDHFILKDEQSPFAVWLWSGYR
ncbi:hypothetical protein [Neisseria polysaccharea]|uniref:LPD3 domain-containing protein n=1 Tax=Neisseria polysaccharea TaxID=489 RepID=UPI0002F355A0|nr:hypothetical protein [Neisseria polysaccharea]